MYRCVYVYVYICAYVYVYMYIYPPLCLWHVVECPEFPWGSLVPWALGLKVLKGQDKQITGIRLRALAWPNFDQFFDHVLISISMPSWTDFGANLAPTWPPKSTQNRSKSHPNSIPTCILFLIAFWIDFRTNLHRFLIPQSTKNPSKFNQKVNQTSQQPKNKKVNNYLVGPMKSCPRPCYVGCKNV